MGVVGGFEGLIVVSDNDGASLWAGGWGVVRG